MNEKQQLFGLSPYMEFSREQWAALRDSEPLTLTEEEIASLKGINEDLSLDEVLEIYLPLSRLLNFYIDSNLQNHVVLEKFLGVRKQRVPYIISVAGSVAVGKSTSARVLQALLSRWSKGLRVELVTTDGFLLPNQILRERDMMKKKGFPQSYDIMNLVRFVSEIKSGKAQVEAPVYSHLIYDIIAGETQVVEQPDILILEGLNVLQSGMDYPTLLTASSCRTLSTSLFTSTPKKICCASGISTVSLSFVRGVLRSGLLFPQLCKAVRRAGDQYC